MRRYLAEAEYPPALRKKNCIVQKGTPLSRRGKSAPSALEDRISAGLFNHESLFTEPGWNMHTAAEIGIDDFQAKRSPDERYRTAPLKGLWAHTKGGFYHDGRFATLRDVVEHYDNFFRLRLTNDQKNDLIEYLKSI